MRIIKSKKIIFLLFFSNLAITVSSYYYFREKKGQTQSAPMKAQVVIKSGNRKISNSGIDLTLLNRDKIINSLIHNGSKNTSIQLNNIFDSDPKSLTDKDALTQCIHHFKNKQKGSPKQPTQLEWSIFEKFCADSM